MILPERHYSYRDISYYPDREKAFFALQQKLELLPIAGASDPSKAINEFAEVMFLYEKSQEGTIFDIGASKRCKEKWLSEGFSEPIIRPLALQFVAGADLFTDPALKTLSLLTLMYQGSLDIAESEELISIYAKKVSLGIFANQNDALSFLSHLHDITREMLSKRYIDHFVSRSVSTIHEPKEQVTQFFNSDMGQQIRKIDTVFWFTNDDHRSGNHDMPYTDIARSTFHNIIATPLYQQFIKINQLEHVPLIQQYYQQWLGKS